jgi:hypothetical protein
MATTTPDQIKMQIGELQQLIQSAHPRMPILLKDIHKILMADPENVTLLDEESIGIIVAGLKKQTATEITAGALKKKSTLKNTTLADL